MKQLISGIYEWFEWMYGSNLANYLSGYCNNGNSNLYGDVWLFLILIPVSAGFLFYFVLANMNFYRPKQWFTLSGICCTLMLIIATYMTYTDLSEELVCESVNYGFMDCLMFGLTNAIYTFILFLFVSMGLRLIGKKSARYTPFKFN